MIRVKLYGQPTSTYEFAKMTLLDECEKAGISVELEEIQDVNVFIEEGIRSVPTFKINNHLEIAYSQQSDIAQFMHETITTILKEENFGNMKKLVVPTDFSNTSKNAISFAFDLAKKSGHVIKIVHAYHPVANEIEGHMTIEPHLEQIKREQLKKFIESEKSWTSSSDAPFIDEEFRLGFAADEIVSLSKEDQVDVVIMGSTGKGGKMKQWFGSVSLEVVKRACCPVIIIPPGAKYHGFNRVLMATDDLLLDSKTLKKILRLLVPHKVQIHLVHVNTLEGKTVMDKLQNWIQVKYPDLDVIHHEITHMDVIEGLESYVNEAEIDLLVMTRARRSLWQGFIHQSITRQMAIRTPIPLMVCHEGDKNSKSGSDCHQDKDEDH